MTRLAGKVAIVTGASAGIGAETAKRFAAEGAKVVVVARTVERAQSVVDQIKAKGGEALAVACDIGNEEQIKAMVEKTIATYGRIDVLDNNAALTDSAVHMADGAVADMDSALWDRIMAVNLRGPMLCSKYVIPHMLKQGGGSIIFVTSGKGTQGDLGQSAYGASKAALIESRPECGDAIRQAGDSRECAGGWSGHDRWSRPEHAAADSRCHRKPSSDALSRLVAAYRRCGVVSGV